MATFSRQQRLTELNQRFAQQTERIERESQPIPVTATGVTPAGDERRLRGIPAIGRGVTGAIPGTAPHSQRW